MKRRIYPIANDVARCRPTVEPCDKQEQCMRYKAPLPTFGASLFDGMVERRPQGLWLQDCLHFLPISPDESQP